LLLDAVVARAHQKYDRPVPTIFTRIINGELPGEFVWADDRCVAFLSINPITSGHAVVVPRVEIDHWLDLDPELAAHLMVVSHTVGLAQMRAFDAPRVGLEIAGFEVPHCHLHVLPIWGEADLHLANSARSVEPGELAANAERIRVALTELGLA
jgi:diadenosine tetraphosphate (Ap4A) HIT family hydrolase